MADEKAKTSYSAEELEEFKAIILEKLKSSREELEKMNETLKSGVDINADRMNYTEMGSDMADKAQIEQFATRTAKFIDNLENALERINKGTYGKCKVTGKLISKERLRLVPHTQTSIEAKLKQ